MSCQTKLLTAKVHMLCIFPLGKTHADVTYMQLCWWHDLYLPPWQVATYREQKKLADKQRKLQEKAHRIKEESLRDDDNVFDVAFENQGGEAAEHTVSATDIKASKAAS